MARTKPSTLVRGFSAKIAWRCSTPIGSFQADARRYGGCAQDVRAMPGRDERGVDRRVGQAAQSRTPVSRDRRGRAWPGPLRATVPKEVTGVSGSGTANGRPAAATAQRISTRRDKLGGRIGGACGSAPRRRRASARRGADSLAWQGERGTGNECFGDSSRSAGTGRGIPAILPDSRSSPARRQWHYVQVPSHMDLAIEHLRRLVAEPVRLLVRVALREVREQQLPGA